MRLFVHSVARRAVVAIACLLVLNAVAQAPASPGKELPPPALPAEPTGKAANLASQLPPARTPIAASVGEPPARVADTPPLPRLEDPPTLPPMSLREPRAGAAAATPPPLLSADPIVVDDIRDGAIRTGVRVTPRNGMSYTLTDPRHEGTYMQSELSPLNSKVAAPRWQVFKW
jgi:hypothetical protein